MFPLWFPQQEEKKEPDKEKSEWSHWYFKLPTKFLISLVCCLQEAEQDFSEKQPDYEYSAIYANIHRPSSPLPDIALYSQQPSHSEQHVKTLHMWINIKYFHTEISKPYELFTLLCSVSIIDGKRGYLLITENHIQRFGLFERQYRCAVLTVGSLSPSVGGSFSLLVLLSIFKTLKALW